MHPTEIAAMQYLTELKSQLETAKHGAAGALIEAAVQRLQLTRPTIYRRLRALGYQSGRKIRADKGDCLISDEAIRAVAGIMAAPTRANGKRIMHTGDAIQIALANQLIDRPASPTTLLRVMRERGLHPDQVERATPHVTMRSLYPNHVWQIDPSICVLYYLHDHSMRVMERDEFYKNKLHNTYRIANDRIWRYVLTDHASGAIYARYYQTAGENTESLFDFMMSAMHRRDGFVMHGVPHSLVWDCGSANTSHAIQSMLTALGIAHWAHRPGNSRAKGQVEQGNNLVETKFEGRLAFQQIDGIAQINAALDDWLIGFNSTMNHSRHGHTRWAAWQLITTEQLRLPPPVETCRNLLNCKPEKRIVRGNLTVQFQVKGYPSAFYSVAHVPGVRNGEPVMVTVNPYRAPSIWVVVEDAKCNTSFIEADPIAEDRFGFPVDAPVFGERYSAKADGDVDTARKELREAAWGTRDEREAKAARKGGRVAYDGTIDPFKDARERKAVAPAFMARRGTELNVPNPVQIELRPLDLIAAMKELRARLQRPLSAEDNASVREWYPDGVPETEIESLVQRLTAPAVERVATALRIVR